MGIILKSYKEGFIQRFDKDGIIPYLSHDDFSGLSFYKNTFINSIGLKISYFVYHYDNYKNDKVILFCPGIGPGHTAYIREIEYLARWGYLVITLDYTGTSESEGETLLSVNEPTRDVIDLLIYLRSAKDEQLTDLDKKEIILIGHSLGGYTALNVINISPFITKAVIISGFITVSLELKGLTHIPFSFLFNGVKRFEKKTNYEYSKTNNIKYLKKTKDRILFIHSIDDKMVPYKNSTYKFYKNNKKDNFSFLITSGKGHNPNYTVNAVNYMKETFSTFNALCNDGTLKTQDEKIAYMKERDIFKMTEQDDQVFSAIIEFIEK